MERDFEVESKPTSWQDAMLPLHQSRLKRASHPHAGFWGYVTGLLTSGVRQTPKARPSLVSGVSTVNCIIH